MRDFQYSPISVLLCLVVLLPTIRLFGQGRDSTFVDIELIRKQYEGKIFWLTARAAADSSIWHVWSEQKLSPLENCRLRLERIFWRERRGSAKGAREETDSLWLHVRLYPANSRMNLRASIDCGQARTPREVATILDRLLSKSPRGLEPGEVAGMKQGPVIQFVDDIGDTTLGNEEKREFIERLGVTHRHFRGTISSDLRAILSDSLFDWLCRDERLRFYAEFEDHRIRCVVASRSIFFANYIFVGIEFDFPVPYTGEFWLCAGRQTSLAINLDDGKIYILNDVPQGMDPPIPVFAPDIDSLLVQLSLYPLPIDSTKEFLIRELFPYIIFPNHCILLESVKDLCYFDQSMKKENEYLPLLQTDSLLRREHFAPVNGKLATPELYWTWESLFDQWCEARSTAAIDGAVTPAEGRDSITIEEWVRRNAERIESFDKYDVRPFTICKDSASLSVKGMIWLMSSGNLSDWDIEVHSDGSVRIRRSLIAKHYGPLTGCEEQ